MCWSSDVAEAEISHPESKEQRFQLPLTEKAQKQGSLYIQNDVTH